MHDNMFQLGEVDKTFLEEVWALYGIGMLILTLRFVIRLRTVGLRSMQGDDLFALLVTAFYTIDAVTVHHVYYMSTNVEASVIQKDRTLSAAEIAQLTEGSKQQLVAWYSYATLVWCLKGTMIFFFKRMTMGLSQQRLVNYIGYACVLTYLVVMLTITFGCWPVYKNYQIVPDPGQKCTLKPQNFIVMTILNVLTDAAILYVPVPLLWALQVPLRQKLVIGVLLSSGIFVISAAIIRIVSTLSANPSALTVNRWGVRETLVGIIAVNAPILRPIVSRAFWSSGAYLSDKGASGSGGGLTGSGGRTLGTANGDGGAGPYELAQSDQGSDHHNPHARHLASSKAGFNSSEENIITKDMELGERVKDRAVVIETTYEVRTEERQQDAQHTRWNSGTGAFSEARAFRDSTVRRE